MAQQNVAKLAKQELVIEAVRQGFEGDDSVEFIQKGGFAMTVSGIARHLRSMGGRGKVKELIDAGHTNVEIMEYCFPEADLAAIKGEHLRQPDLFHGDSSTFEHAPAEDSPLYSTTKLTMRIPSDLYEAIRAASHAEGKTQTQLVVDLLTSALSRMPDPIQEVFEEQ